MELSHEDAEKYIDLISSRVKIVDVGNKVFMFKGPRKLDLIKAKRIYDQEYSKAIKDGLLSIESMRKILSEREILSKEDRNKLSRLKSQLEAQKALLAKTTKVKANQDRIKDIIHKLVEEIGSLESKEHSKFSMTAETRSEESKILYLCWCCSFDFLTNKRHWNTYDDFSRESDLLFRQKALSEFILFHSGISTEIVRALARHNLWRIRYVTSMKTSEPLFGVPTSEYSNDMLNLAYWSHYYQNVYEMMPEDQPSEDIIEDDEALDAYLQDYYSERNKEAAARKDKNKRGHKSKLNAFDKEEVIVTRSNELYEDINYDTPKESQLIKDRNLIKKKASNKHRVN